MVCNGSFDPCNQLGTLAFVMVADKQKKTADSRKLVPGTSANQSLYRSKRTGFDSVLSALAIIVKHFDIKK